VRSVILTPQPRGRLQADPDETVDIYKHPQKKKKLPQCHPGNRDLAGDVGQRLAGVASQTRSQG
jgi:hypothetical protein